MTKIHYFDMLKVKHEGCSRVSTGSEFRVDIESITTDVE